MWFKIGREIVHTLHRMQYGASTKDQSQHRERGTSVCFFDSRQVFLVLEMSADLLAGNASPAHGGGIEATRHALAIVGGC